MMRRLFLMIIFCCLQLQAAVSQDIVARAQVDTNKIVIGKPVELVLQLSQPKNVNIDWPLIIDSVGGMEIIKLTPPDTLKVDDPSVLLRSQTFIITSFDSGVFVIPALSFKYKLNGNDKVITTETDPLQIEVFTVPVDTTKEIRDIRPIEEAPFDMKWVWYGLAALVIIALVIALIVWGMKKRKPVAAGPAVVELVIPPHIVALEALVALDEERVWQNGQVKLYYTQLTDILRTYIEKRYGFSTLELTSDEILSHAAVKVIPENTREELERILRLADLVKFAKWQAIPSENEWAMQLAQKFVRDTAPADSGNSSQPVTQLPS